MQSARIIAVGITAADGTGRISAAIIPMAAISASPTNGCRGALSNFIYPGFSLIRPLQGKPQKARNTQYTTDRPNVPSFRAKSRNPVALPEGNTRGSFDFASLRSG